MNNLTRAYHKLLNFAIEANELIKFYRTREITTK